MLVHYYNIFLWACKWLVRQEAYGHRAVTFAPYFSIENLAILFAA
jgi:hypothetical protein